MKYGKYCTGEGIKQFNRKKSIPVVDFPDLPSQENCCHRRCGLALRFLLGLCILMRREPSLSMRDSDDLDRPESRPEIDDCQIVRN